MKRAIGIVVACAALTATAARGEVVITVNQVGNNVEFTGSGTLNLTGLTYSESGSSGGYGASVQSDVAGVYNFGSNFGNFSITLGEDAAGLLGAHRWRRRHSSSLRLGSLLTAPPPAYTDSAATAFLAPASSALRRINSASRGI